MKIKENQRIFFRVPEATNKKYEAEVHLVGTSIDKSSRTVKVHGHLHDDKNHYFVIGMFVEAEIEIFSKKAIALPEAAVIEDGDYKVVLKSDKINNTDKILIKGAYPLTSVDGTGYSH